MGSGGETSADPGLLRFVAGLKPGGDVGEAETILVRTIESFAAEHVLTTAYRVVGHLHAYVDVRGAHARR